MVEETFYSVKRVNIRGKSIDTPKKSVNLERVREDIGIHAEFFEIYRTLNEERIESLIADAGKQEESRRFIPRIAELSQIEESNR